MEKILKDANVRPKVEISVEEYNHLVDLARMKAKKIEERALQLYKENGVCKIHVDARIPRKRTWDDNSDTETLHLDVDPWWVETNDEYGPKPFALDSKMVARIKRFVKSVSIHIFDNEFGEHLSVIENVMRYKAETERIRNKFIIVTMTGWLAALVMCVVAVLK